MKKHLLKFIGQALAVLLFLASFLAMIWLGLAIPD
jgi:hypothetical protein